jgi:hypothetical protein
VDPSSASKVNVTTAILSFVEDSLGFQMCRKPDFTGIIGLKHAEFAPGKLRFMENSLRSDAEATVGRKAGIR